MQLIKYTTFYAETKATEIKFIKEWSWNGTIWVGYGAVNNLNKEARNGNGIGFI
jgi:hypothetical protein